MACKPQYKGKRYNSLEELYKANGVNPQQKQQAIQLYSQYLDTITNEAIVYKGMKNKAGYVHDTPNHSFFTNSFNIADKWYNDNTGIKTFAIPKVSVESYKATTNKGVSTLRKQEENYINNSDAGLIKLETNDIGGLQTQYVVNKKYQPLELGSKQDIEEFKDFVQGGSNNIKPGIEELFEENQIQVWRADATDGNFIVPTSKREQLEYGLGIYFGDNKDTVVNNYQHSGNNLHERTINVNNNEIFDLDNFDKEIANKVATEFEKLGGIFTFLGKQFRNNPRQVFKNLENQIEGENWITAQNTINKVLKENGIKVIKVKPVDYEGNFYTVIDDSVFENQDVDLSNVNLSDLKIDKSSKQDIEGFKEYMKSQQKDISLPMDKTKKDIIDNIELYKNFIGDMTAEDIQSADSNTIAEILKKICK